MAHHDDEGKAPDPYAMAWKLFYLTVAGVIAYAVAAYIAVEVVKP